MSIKLSDTQLVVLSLAAQRDDRCLTLPEKLKGAAAHRVMTKLIAAGLVEEVKAKTGMPVWRDEQDGQSYALTLTAAGAKAIAVNPDDDASPVRDEERSPPEGDRRPTSAESDRTAAGASASESAQAFATPRAPRVDTKLAKAIEMLRATEGATIAELAQAMGWLPHTTYAVLTGLRKRGYALTLDRSDAKRGSAYRIVLDANAAQQGTTPTATEPPVSAPIDGGSDPAASRASATASRRSRATRTPRAA